MSGPAGADGFIFSGAAEPPEYPAVTPVTPSRVQTQPECPRNNRRKHHSRGALDLAAGSSVAGLGIFTAALEALHATVLPRQSWQSCEG